MQLLNFAMRPMHRNPWGANSTFHTHSSHTPSPALAPSSVPRWLLAWMAEAFFCHLQACPWAAGGEGKEKSVLALGKVLLESECGHPSLWRQQQKVHSHPYTPIRAWKWEGSGGGSRYSQFFFYFFTSCPQSNNFMLKVIAPPSASPAPAITVCPVHNAKGGKISLHSLAWTKDWLLLTLDSCAW